MRGFRITVVGAGIFLAATFSANAYGQGKIKVVKPKTPATQPAEQTSSEPDKVLYTRAMTDLTHKRYDEERLSLETLINTYPDSEYLDKAKLAVADSYYAEGGTSNLTQAVGEYQSFIVFFPDDDKAPYAQMQIGMAHYKMMEKSDRDTSEALNAEASLQTFITKYQDQAEASKLIPGAEQQLRNVQEVIADGEYKVARFYYLRPDYLAAAARLTELTERYPLYSQSDEALWMLSNIYAKAKSASKNEDVKNHYSDLEGKVLDQIVINYPLSARAAAAKDLLKGMGMAVPAADPDATARMKKQQAFERASHKNSMLAGPESILKTGPDFSLAAQSGMPNLTPPSDAITARDILSPTNNGPHFGLAVANTGDSISGGASGATVAPASAVSDSSSEPGAIVGAPTTSSSSDASNDPTGGANAPTTSASPASTDPAPASDSAAPQAGSSDSSASSSSSNSAPAAGQSSDSTQTATPANSSESSSKNKKKGMSKLNPF